MAKIGQTNISFIAGQGMMRRQCTLGNEGIGSRACMNKAINRGLGTPIRTAVMVKSTFEVFKILGAIPKQMVAFLNLVKYFSDNRAMRSASIDGVQ